MSRQQVQRRQPIAQSQPQHGEVTNPSEQFARAMTEFNAMLDTNQQLKGELAEANTNIRILETQNAALEIENERTSRELAYYMDFAARLSASLSNASALLNGFQETIREEQQRDRRSPETKIQEAAQVLATTTEPTQREELARKLGALPSLFRHMMPTAHAPKAANLDEAQTEAETAPAN
jgi:chromosome segregation ATPase